MNEGTLRRVIREVIKEEVNPRFDAIDRKLDIKFEGVNNSFSLVMRDIEEIKKSLSNAT